MEHIRAERPQGFQDGKMAKKGLYRCTWGCDQIFCSRTTAADHFCESRKRTYENLIEMNKMAGKIPPQRYLYQASAGSASQRSYTFQEIRENFKNEKHLFLMAWMDMHF